MSRLSIKTLAAVMAIWSALAPTQAAMAEPRENAGRHRKILMFGASWCTPCVAELRNIAMLAADAGSDHILIVWTDDGIGRFRGAIPGNVTIASAEQAKILVREHASEIVGLPYSVMLTAQGRKCADWRTGLTSEAITRMRSACRADQG